MKVLIDGTEYVAVTAKRIVVDGVAYAEVTVAPIPEPAVPVKIIDNDDDVWIPSTDEPGYYRCITSAGLRHRTRNQIKEYWDIAAEEF